MLSLGRIFLLPLLPLVFVASQRPRAPQPAPQTTAGEQTDAARSPTVVDAFARGVELLERGKAREALALLTEAERSAGTDASAALLYDHALAALQSGEIRASTTSAEKMAARGGARFFGLRDFLRGNAAFIEGERAEAESALQEADPVALRLAIQHVEKARAAWIRAAMTRDDWIEARRNVARANRKLEILEIKRQAAEDARKTKKEKQKKKKRRGPMETEEREAQMLRASKLSPRELAALLAKIDANDAEKRALRREMRGKKQSGVERDW